MANKISVILDVATDKAVSSLKNFRTAINDADTVTGKFKAGASGAFNFVKGNAVEFATAAVGALALFAVKAVEAFTGVSKSAIDLAAATGLTTEQASRFIAIGDDMGVTAEQLTTGLARVAKELDSGKWEEYGVATRDASGQARSTNDILLDTFDMLGKVKNETERARIGNELFGRGYANLAPLIGSTRAEYEAMLGAVEDGQVITDEEAAKAEEMRLAQDALADALQEVQLAVGKLVTELAPLIDQMANATIKGLEFVDMVGGKMADAVNAAEIAFGGGEKELSALTDAVVDAAVKQDLYSTSLQMGVTHLNELEASTTSAEEATQQLSDEIAGMLGYLSEEKAWLNVSTSLENFRAKVLEGTMSVDEQRLGLINIQQELLAYVDGLAAVPTEVKSAIVADIIEGDLASAEEALTNLARQRFAPISPVPGAITNSSGYITGYQTPGAKYGATGGIVTRPTLAVVGEAGPEAVVPLKNTGPLSGAPGASPLPSGGRGFGSTINVTAQVLGAVDDMTATRIAEAIRRVEEGRR